MFEEALPVIWGSSSMKQVSCSKTKHLISCKIITVFRGIFDEILIKFAGAIGIRTFDLFLMIRSHCLGT
jgi:hypothetical protein